jgi:hypothetical protein
VEGSQERLVAYDENDEVVTQFVEPLHHEPTWLVQITPYDRRSMTRERLLVELRSGGLVNGGTLVWRDGMRNWSTVARVGELGAPETLPPARREAPAQAAVVAPGVLLRSRSEATVVLASSATSALIVGVTLALLAWGGVFAAGGHTLDPSSASASR